MSIIAKYKFDSSIYADLLPEFNAEFTSDLYNTTDEEVDGIITRTIESDSLPTLMRFGRVWVEGETDTDNRTDSLLEVLDMDTSGLTDCHSMFRHCKNLTGITCNWNTSNVITMYAMLDSCTNLIILDASNWNTSKVTSMGGMFNHCTNLTSLDVSNFDTSNVTNMGCMFNYCQSLISLDVSNFDISNVIGMDGMFSATDKLISLDISNFNISDTTNIDYILSRTPLLTDIGMLYCNQSTINKIASVLPTDITQTIWVEDVDVKDLTSVEGVEFKQYAKNTEIMLTSPLLEGDKLIVKDGKLYHYHKMGKVVLDGSEDWILNTHWTNSSYRRFHLAFKTSGNWLSLKNDKFKTIVFDGNADKQFTECISCYNTGAEVVIQKNNILTLDEFKQWLSENPTTVVYGLASPYYELISEDPLDISIISETVDITNSSNIPLNMTINNKGLSTIAMSPSTTYTVAFDKDTDSEVVVNLCGNEVTTTDNIVEITTPSEIDDELIFYGDGVEISNVRLLEGSVSGDSVPRETFEGLKNSFEDGYIPENILQKTASQFSTTLSRKLNKRVSKATIIQFNTDKIVRYSKFDKQDIWIRNVDVTDKITLIDLPNGEYFNTVVVALNADHENISYSSIEEFENKEIIILEGDWTHLTEEDFNHLGKYKVEYKVTGKNKWKTDLIESFKMPEGEYYSNTGYTLKDLCPDLIEGQQYKVSFDYDETGYTGNGSISIALIPYLNISNEHFTYTKDMDNMFVYFYGGSLYNTFTNIQIEEGTQATEYEPYKEFTKTFYLNSPLLEGDTIEEVNGVATHVKRYKKVVLDGSEAWIHDASIARENTSWFQISCIMGGYNNFYCDKFKVWGSTYSDSVEAISTNSTKDAIQIRINDSRLSTIDLNGFKQWLQANPTTVVYELASPQYEPISDDSILCDSYVNGHLDFDTNVPVEKVEFKHFDIPLVYSQPNTMYKVQFEADNNGILDNLDVSGGKVINTNVIKGLNRFTVTTPNKLLYNWFTMSGIGFNASNIQVVATDRDVDFGYFKGLQSSFESELVTDEADENYGKYKVECKVVGKNKFDLSKLPTSLEPINNGFRYDTSKGVISVLDMFNIDKNKQYTLKCMVQQVTTNNYSAGFNIIYEDDTFETCINYNGEVSLTTKKAIKDIRMTFYNHTITDITNIQIEEGTVATEYEPYQEYTKTIHLNSPLLKGDTIEVHNGKLCHYHKMGMIVLDGSGIFFLHEEDTSKIVFRVYEQVGELYSAKHNSLYMTDNNFGGCDNISIADYSPTKDSVYLYITFDKSKSSHALSVDGFKQWLQANPTTVVYELANPYYEEIVPMQEDLIITSVKEGDLHIDTIVPISSKVTYNVNVQLLTDFEQSIVEQVQATQTTDLQSILDEEIDN